MFNVCARVIAELDDASREKGVVVLLASPAGQADRRAPNEHHGGEDKGLKMTTPTDDDDPVDGTKLYPPGLNELIRQAIERKLAKLSPEEGRRWLERTLTMLTRDEIVDRRPEEDGERE